jgi:hypothetical protein
VDTAKNIYSSLSDTARLVSDLNFFNANLGGAHSQAYGEYVGTITARLRSLGFPGFAAGGWHRGGVRIVGERGPEIEATGPARYFSARQTQALLAGATADNQNVVPLVSRLIAVNEQQLQEQKAGRHEIRELRAQLATRDAEVQALERENQELRLQRRSAA